MDVKMGWIFLGAVLSVRTVAGLSCYDCSALQNASGCNTTSICHNNEVCYKTVKHTSSGVAVEFGCQGNQACGGSSNPNGGHNLIGRRQATGDCHECCGTDLCNRRLCFHLRPSACVDDPTFDCPRLSSFLNVCADIDHAKNICPRFCGFCDVVDGQWMEWSNWSSCDVTCSNGTRTRERHCTEPKYGGADCVGVRREMISCSKQPCPVHGGWSMWSLWGECSVTCDVGLQRRDRSCSNPYPDLYGDHCFGQGRDDRICILKPCTDGGWSEWQSWGACPVTCGGALQRRTRTCDNPAPSPFGRACVGTDTDSELCNNNPCKEPPVAFHVSNVVEINSFNKTVVLRDVMFSEGGGYNNISGMFYAPVDGLYLFSAHLCARTNREIYFRLIKMCNTCLNEEELGNSFIYFGNNGNCGQLSAVVRLHINDAVAVKFGGETSATIYDIWRNDPKLNLFNGVRISD